MIFRGISVPFEKFALQNTVCPKVTQIMNSNLASKKSVFLWGYQKLIVKQCIGCGGQCFGAGTQGLPFSI